MRETMLNVFPRGTVHDAGEDFEASVRADPKVVALWESLTPLGRNEFICWATTRSSQQRASIGLSVPATN